MYPDEDIVVQQRITQTEDRQEYLDSFFNKRNALGFAITAGVFGEGIDYTGESLIGAIVVGTGLPGLSLQQSLLKDHFDAGGFNGFDYISFCRGWINSGISQLNLRVTFAGIPPTRNTRRHSHVHVRLANILTYAQHSSSFPRRRESIFL